MESQDLSYNKLFLYQKSKDLLLLIYDLTANYPKEEQFILVPQIRRAALSILLNIVEGYSKDSSKEYARFLTISIGSLVELEVQMEISHSLNYITKDNLDNINISVLEVKKLLFGTRKSIRSK